MKRLIAFDLDGTLAESRQPVTPAMAEALCRLAAHVPVSIISGGDRSRFDWQLLGPAGALLPRGRVLLQPLQGACLYLWDGGWQTIWEHLLPPAERARITRALRAALAAPDCAGLSGPGARIEDRGAQISFVGIGARTEADARRRFDPDGDGRRRLAARLRLALPDHGIRLAGDTSVDVSAPGTDKAAGLGLLLDRAGIARGDVLFLGDSLEPGGNDHPVRAAGIDCIAVAHPGETMAAIAAIGAMLGDAVVAMPSFACPVAEPRPG
jgi:HAD superfamily hydrolase (TIGR01484 family)